MRGPGNRGLRTKVLPGSDLGLPVEPIRMRYKVLAILLVSFALYALHTLSMYAAMNKQLSKDVWMNAMTAAEKKFAHLTDLRSLEQFLVREEAELEGASSLQGATIRDRHKKTLIWAKPTAPDRKQKWSIVYVHGFSAGPLELEPTISNLAEKLEANLYLTRLSAHGLSDGESFATVKAQDWVRDVAEAVEVGKAIGDNVLLMGTSTGAALVLRYMDVAPLLSEPVKSLILLSPNYKVSAFGAEILGNEFGRSLARVLVGSHRAFDPENELHANRWTTNYRSEALHELILVTLSARGVALENLKIPVLTIYTKKDEVVSVDEIEKRAKRFRHPQSMTIDWDAGRRHELASATFDSQNIESLVSLMSDWVAKLEIGARKNQNESSH